MFFSSPHPHRKKFNRDNSFFCGSLDMSHLAKYITQIIFQINIFIISNIHTYVAHFLVYSIITHNSGLKHD